MNEGLFFLHIFITVFFLLLALRSGKEALTALISLQAILANLFVLKQMNLFGYEVTCSDVYAIGSMLGMNLLQEFFGREAVKRAIWICFGALVLFGIASQLHLLYQPSAFDSYQDAFGAILSPTPRLIIASFITYFIVQQVDLRLFGWLKSKAAALSLIWRSTFTLILCQLLDTAFFSFLALYGIVESVPDVMLLGFGIKVVIILCSTPFTALAKKIYSRTLSLS